LIGAIARVHSCLAHGDVQAASSLTMTILDAGDLFRDPTARSILDFSRGLFESVLDFAGLLRLASLLLLVELEQQSIVCLPRPSTLRTPASERNRRAG
jgi:hypothetical protein